MHNVDFLASPKVSSRIPRVVTYVVTHGSLIFSWPLMILAVANEAICWCWLSTCVEAEHDEIDTHVKCMLLLMLLLCVTPELKASQPMSPCFTGVP